MIPLPDKKYQIVYADPPWTYKDKAQAGKRGAGFKYDLMSIDEIKKMDVQSITAENAVLFMWATFPLLKQGIETIQSWGFEYKTIGFTWIKMNKKKQTPFMGMGNWTRSNAEICLIAVKGKPKRISAGVRSVIMSPIQEHSRKPDEVRDKIVELMGDIPRIELFARQSTPGWDVWGNEV